jgi:hypothetical protein
MKKIAAPLRLKKFIENSKIKFADKKLGAGRLCHPKQKTLTGFETN